MREFKSAAAVVGNIGLVRGNNEDNFYFNGTYLTEENRDIPSALAENCINPLQFFAVCDGMGGEAFGEVASLIAVQTLAKYHEMLDSITYHSMDKYVDMYIAEVNNLITEESAKNEGKRIGATLALLCIEGDMAHCYNVGDSRIYLLRGRKLKQISEDHTQAVRAVKMGVMTAEQAQTHPHRNKLTQHLGIAPEEMIVEPYRCEFALKKNDKYFLCSDGITDLVNDAEIEQLLKQKQSEDAIAASLVDLALQKGGKDNITSMVVRVTV